MENSNGMKSCTTVLQIKIEMATQYFVKMNFKKLWNTIIRLDFVYMSMGILLSRTEIIVYIFLHSLHPIAFVNIKMKWQNVL